jgi:Uma2 family endonuclease
MPTAKPLPARGAVLRTAPAKPPKRQLPMPAEYPESDGKPMSETPIHWHATVDFAHPLMDRYAARPDAYVGSDLLMYYEEGNTTKRVSPDVFVAFGPSREPQRRTWLVWEEGKAADFVLEVTSNSTRHKDEGFKADLYERLGVTEYWQFDPTGDYLFPTLKGRRLGPEGVYEAIDLEPGNGGLAGFSAVLGLELRPEGETLRLFDPELGDFLPTSKEKSRIIEAVMAERKLQAEARRAAEARVAELERQLDLKR